MSNYDVEVLVRKPYKRFSDASRKLTLLRKKKIKAWIKPEGIKWYVYWIPKK